ncbi:MAG: sigma-54-dependent Fis family transcriptional regulator [Deltaproteobacteria bacterium]|nr:sigma-54-dependent Fis family transcriptional regulator [Deltaproteobacteria bacterium]
MARVLIIDDDEYMQEILSKNLLKLDLEADAAGLLSEASDLIVRNHYDLVFLDVRLPDGNGLDFFQEMQFGPSDPEVIIITGVGDPEGAELAIANGAWDYLQKPFSQKEILLLVKRALDYREKKLRKEAPVLLDVEGIIGRSSSLRASLQLVAQCAASETNVLISGETGTGKELFARAIHMNSRKPRSKFIIVDCAALPDNLTESILFGHVRGAFTGAVQGSEGLIKQAHGGTLFLDEVGELPLSVQKSFLRVLQERSFRPVGGITETQSDFRLISATNQDLDDMVEQGRFRRDLLHRLRTISIELPPLRERREDIKEVALYYVDKLSKKNGLPMKGVLPEFMEMLERYEWKGNVRELINAIEKAILANINDPLLYPQYLPREIRVSYAREEIIRKRGEVFATPETPNKNAAVTYRLAEPIETLKKVREEALQIVETLYLQKLMESTDGNLNRASRISGLSKNRLYVLLKHHGISTS